MIVDPELAERYTDAGWWQDRSIGDLVREHAERRPDLPAYIEPERTVSWREYDGRADAVAAALAGAGVPPGARVALLLPDGADFHVAALGAERAGAVAVGIGARAGDAEVAHLARHTGAAAIVTTAEHRGRDMSALPVALADLGAQVPLHLVLADDGEAAVNGPGDPPAAPAPSGAERGIGPNDLWMINSTSGTTGLPKCVMQHQNRWICFARLAARAGRLDGRDVLLGAVPAPFGFGLWSAHVTPAVLGVPAVVLPRFETTTMIEMIERERPTVLCAVSTQFRMLMRSARAGGADLASVRVVFTGGEAIPYEDAAEFEERTGAVVLNFFGSNESGAFSCTTADDPREARLTTGGRVLPEMDVRLFDEAGADVTATGGPGQPGGKGPLLSPGYYADDAANAELFTGDGYLLMGDLVTIGEDGYVRVAGRKSDIIIRGGKNISVQQVEQAVASHPAVELCAVVPVPDDLYGERVCAVVSVLPGRELTLDALAAHLLDAAGLSRELLPEHLVVLPELPRSSGDKIAKGEVRRIAVERLTGA